MKCRQKDVSHKGDIKLIVFPVSAGNFFVGDNLYKM